MDLRRLRLGEWILAISGLALIVSLFLPWWEVPGVEGAYFDRATGAPEYSAIFKTGDATLWSAWDVMSVTDVLLALLGVAAIVAWIVAASAKAAGPGVAAEALVTPFALVMAIVVAIRLLNVPGELELPSFLEVEAGLAYGAWVGLAATLGVLAGALVAMRDERLSSEGALTDATGLPVERAVEVEKLPAPPPA